MPDDGTSPSIRIPVKSPHNRPDPDSYTRIRNASLRLVRCRGERMFRPGPKTGGAAAADRRQPRQQGSDITHAALVLTNFEYGYLK